MTSRVCALNVVALSANESHKISISGQFSYNIDLIPAFIIENIHFLEYYSAVILVGNLQTACRVYGLWPNQQTSHFGIKTFSTLTRAIIFFFISRQLKTSKF